jgi:leader peptidase (prepilin peptidase)/N-methyltransferase
LQRERVVGLVASLGALLGLIAGSFINVVAHRVPAEASVVRPRSACPSCGHEIRNRDNIPVLSWLLLRGRCRDCQEPISVRYPLVELLTAVLFALVPIVLGVSWVVPAYWWFVGVSIVLVLTDLDHHRIPNKILLPGTVVGAALLGAGSAIDSELEAFARALAAGAAYFGLLFVIALIARGGFGFGDVKLAFFLGLFLGYQSWGVLFAGIALAFLIGGLVATGLLVTRRKGRRDAIPFGPALVAGALVAVAVGQELADWYTRAG